MLRDVIEPDGSVSEAHEEDLRPLCRLQPGYPLDTLLRREQAIADTNMAVRFVEDLGGRVFRVVPNPQSGMARTGGVRGA